MLGHYSVFKQQLFVCHIQIKLKINFDLKNRVDKTAVDEIGVDEPGRYHKISKQPVHIILLLHEDVQLYNLLSG